MSRSMLPSEQILSLLAQTPARIAALTADLAPTHWRTPPSQGEWSASDVLAHLRACADVWGGCMATIITEDSPTLRAINPVTWITRTDYLDLEFRPSLQSFATQRAGLLALLEPLPREGWSRSATVTGAGRVLQRTVLFYGDWLARHERQHIRQVEQIVSTVRR